MRSKHATLIKHQGGSATRAWCCRGGIVVSSWLIQVIWPIQVIKHGCTNPGDQYIRTQITNHTSVAAAAAGTLPAAYPYCSSVPAGKSSLCERPLAHEVAAHEVASTKIQLTNVQLKQLNQCTPFLNPFMLCHNCGAMHHKRLQVVLFAKTAVGNCFLMHSSELNTSFQTKGRLNARLSAKHGA